MAEFNLDLDEPLPEPGSVEAIERAKDPIARYLDETVDGPQTDAQDIDPATGEATDKAKAGEQSATVAKASDGSNKDGDGKQTPVKKGKEEQGSTGTPGAGDLVVDGVTYKAGTERRLYEARKVVEGQLASTRNELNQANGKIDRVSEAFRELKQTTSSLHGVDPDTLAVGVKIARDLARDPQGTLRNLLTEAAAAGYAIDGIGATIDPVAVREAVARQFQPYVEFYNNAQSGNTAETEAVQEVNNFYVQHPDARTHDDVLAAVLEKNPQLSVSEAYFQLKLAAVERGLDWSKPLGPQMSGEQQQQVTTQQAATAPLLNGRGPVNNEQVAEAKRVAVAHEDTSTGDIVKAAMREAGLKI